MFTVHEVCKLTGVTRKRLFYYDKIGILKPTRREGTQKAKMYSPRAVEELRRILKYQEAGLRLNEISEILSGDPSMQEAILLRVLARLQEEYRRKGAEMAAAGELLDSIQMQKKESV